MDLAASGGKPGCVVLTLLETLSLRVSSTLLELVSCQLRSYEEKGWLDSVLLLAALPPAQAKQMTSSRNPQVPLCEREQTRLLGAFTFPPALGFVLSFNQQIHMGTSDISTVLLTPG